MCFPNEKVILRGFSALSTLGGFLSLLWGVSSVCSCSCAISWQFQRLCWNDRGKGLFVCLFDSLVLAVHCSDCADQSLLLHVLWNPWEGSEEPRQPWKGQTRVTRLWKRVQNPQPASTGWRPSPENLCSFLPVSLGFSMCCSALLPPCGCTDSPPLLLHWALQGWLSKLSWVGCA